MINRFLLLGCLMLILAHSQCQNLTIFKSKASVKETTEQVINILKVSDLNYFNTVSYDSIASKKGGYIHPTNIITFDDPGLTTSLISCQQTTALDLPLRLLVWEENGDIYIGYIDPRDMKKRFMLNDCEDTIESLTRLMLKVVNDVVRAQQ